MMYNVFYYLLALASLILVSEKEETNFGKLKTSVKIGRCGENLEKEMGGVAPFHWGKWPLPEKFQGPINVFQFAVVEPLYKGHLGDSRKWPLYRG